MGKCIKIVKEEKKLIISLSIGNKELLTLPSGFSLQVCI